jgi:hypothetical protein
MTNIFDQTTAAKTYPLASQIIAAAADGTMEADEIQHTIAGLTKHLEAKAAQDKAKRQRIKKMNAAAADPKYRNIVARVDGELKRLGFDGGINDFAENGNLRKLNEAMRAAAWDNDKRFQLKENAAALGLID